MTKKSDYLLFINFFFNSLKNRIIHYFLGSHYSLFMIFLAHYSLFIIKRPLFTNHYTSSRPSYIMGGSRGGGGGGGGGHKGSGPNHPSGKSLLKILVILVWTSSPRSNWTSWAPLRTEFSESTHAYINIVFAPYPLSPWFDSKPLVRF